MKPHPVFFPFSLIYGSVIWIRNLFFDIGVLRSVDVGVPVISIGNMTTGGTGKTPLVKNAAKIILDSGKCVAIVSRGYGRKTTGTVVVCDGKTILADAVSGGDEPLMLAQNLRTAIVIVDEDRARGAKKAIVEFGAQVIILDDGFQHRYIKRTKDIVVIDAGQMPFDTMLLPAGYRREWIGSLKRASALVITKTKDEGEAERIIKDKRLNAVERKFSVSFRPSGIKHFFGGIAQSLEIMNGYSAVLFCGIAQPDNFRSSVEACGIKVKDLFGFPDHHIYTTAEIESVIASFQKHSADVILTTEKDAVRLRGFEHLLMKLPVSVLIMDADVHQQNEWKQYLLS